MTIDTGTGIPHILTGIDLPHDGPGGSVELLRDLYLKSDCPLPADVFMLSSETEDVSGSSVKSPTLLSVPGKAISGDSFWAYVDRLSIALKERFSASDYDVLHLQHLTFGATPALQRTFPEQAKIAFVHGTDLLYAAENKTQANVLRMTVDTSDAIVVPTSAMADHLRMISPVELDRIAHIPWGVPDHLLRQHGIRTQRHSSTLRVLYAGRLTAEKTTLSIFSAVAELDGVELSIAAPPTEYSRFAQRGHLSAVRYLGWLSRRGLWREFAKHDLLIIPSLKLEAFGLVAIEAQACGLPVMYQPVPGLSEVVGDSGLALDFGDVEGLSTQLKKIRASRSLLEEMSAAGLANSKRFPLSKTALALSDLSVHIMP
ncbi:glycosyltransferase family 4 protein [Streptomyces sp. NPDC102274]|uniref:glycosyltransferase family 4 protein n=1 Tax=Streptomyces sp. NPDC102274 TaxID=3366151 RepID=UPI0038223A6E